MIQFTGLNPKRSPEERQALIEKKEMQFREVILQRLGIILRHSDLQKLILKACTQFECEPEVYLDSLKTCSSDSPLLEFLVADITVGETYFFRDKIQMNLLQHQVLPDLIHKKRSEHRLSLRIWSAGCASGEEIYSLAMMLCELLPDIQRWKLNLLGTDINMEALKKAKLGHYKAWSMRSIEPYYIERYFSKHPNYFILSDQLINSVQFSYLNLNEDTYPSILNGTNAQDLILCRNVLIYFHPENAKKLMKKLSQSLIEGGILLLGASDPVFIEGLNLTTQIQKGMLFVKEKPSEIRPLIQLSSQIPRHKKPSQMKESAITKPQIQTDSLLEAANKAANRGQLEEALKYCKASCDLDRTNKNAYFILALTLIELNRLDEAEKALRQTLFLDYKFVEAHFQLGLLLLKNRAFEAGIKSLENALKIVKKNDPAEPVPGAQGLNYGRFAAMIHKEIELYKSIGEGS